MSSPDSGGNATTASRRRGRGDANLANAIAAVAAVGAFVASTAEPTGLALIDRFWAGAAAALISYAAGRARRWPTFWMAALAAVCSVGSWWCASALIALGIAAASGYQRGRKRSRGAAAGAFSALALLHLPSVGFFSSTLLICLAAVIPVLWSGYRKSPTRVRSTARWSAVALVATSVLLSLGFAGSALLARSDVDEAADLARSGLDQISSGDQAAASVTLSEASTSFAAASDKLDAPWAWPARLIPGVSQQARALSSASAAGRDVTQSAASAAGAAPYEDLRAGAGTVDLDTVRSMQEPIRSTSTEMALAIRELDDVSSSWLLSPVATPIDEFRSELADAHDELERVSMTLDALPDLFGGDGPRSYLVLFTNPAETRNLGGYVGSYGVLTADDGTVTFEVSGSTGDLYTDTGVDPATVSLAMSDEFIQRYDRYEPTRFLGNLTVSPDLATTATLSRSIFGQITGTEVDGVLVVDPIALAALLELTGPVDVEGRDQPLTSDNAADYLLHGQYLEGDANDPSRRDGLEAVGRATFEALTQRDLPAPRTLGEVLGPMVASKHIMFYPFDPRAQQLMQVLGLSRDFVPAPGPDVLSVRTSNVLANKLDYFLHKEVSYSATFTPETQTVRSTVSITLRNDAPPDGLPDYVAAGQPASEGLSIGTTRVRIAVFTPLAWKASHLDGEAVAVEPQRELGLNVFSTLVTVAPGGRATLEYTLEGTIDSGTSYELRVSPQPLVNPDQFSVRVASGSPNWLVDPDQSGVDDGIFHLSTTLETDLTVDLHFSPR